MGSIYSQAGMLTTPSPSPAAMPNSTPPTSAHKEPVTASKDKSSQKNILLERPIDSEERQRDVKTAVKTRAAASRKQHPRAAKSKVKKPVKEKVKSKETQSRASKGDKASSSVKKESTSPSQSLSVELPHKLSTLPVTQSTHSEAEFQSARASGEIKLASIETSQPVLESTKPKRPNSSNSYKLTPGKTPFPDWKFPTPEQCEEVNALLSYQHGAPVAPKTIPQATVKIAGCGEVPCVLDALLRTLLSAATQGRNSSMAYNSLAEKFGVLEDGVGKGGVNWDAVRRAPVRVVYETIQRGGLADIKSRNIKSILEMVYTENEERYAALKTDQPIQEMDGQLTGVQGEDRKYQTACLEKNLLSLDHLHGFSSEDAMSELTKYPGIGVKTAACVLLFCLQRPCFAVDTHIFRLTKWLGWVPANLATEKTAFGHLNARIPDHLKYSLHHLLITHGRTCPRCRAVTGENSEGWDEGCPIDELVTRTGARKGGPKILARQKGKAKESAGKKKATTNRRSTRKRNSSKS